MVWNLALFQKQNIWFNIFNNLFCSELLGNFLNYSQITDNNHNWGWKDNYFNYAKSPYAQFFTTLDNFFLSSFNNRLFFNLNNNKNSILLNSNKGSNISLQGKVNFFSVNDTIYCLNSYYFQSFSKLKKKTFKFSPKIKIYKKLKLKSIKLTSIKKIQKFYLKYKKLKKNYDFFKIKNYKEFFKNNYLSNLDINFVFFSSFVKTFTVYMHINQTKWKQYTYVFNKQFIHFFRKSYKKTKHKINKYKNVKTHRANIMNLIPNLKNLNSNFIGLKLFSNIFKLGSDLDNKKYTTNKKNRNKNPFKDNLNYKKQFNNFEEFDDLHDFFEFENNNYSTTNVDFNKNLQYNLNTNYFIKTNNLKNKQTKVINYVKNTYFYSLRKNVNSSKIVFDFIELVNIFNKILSKSIKHNLLNNIVSGENFDEIITNIISYTPNKNLINLIMSCNSKLVGKALHFSLLGAKYNNLIDLNNLTSGQNNDLKELLTNFKLLNLFVNDLTYLQKQQIKLILLDFDFDNLKNVNELEYIVSNKNTVIYLFLEYYDLNEIVDDIENNEVNEIDTNVENDEIDEIHQNVKDDDVTEVNEDYQNTENGDSSETINITKTFIAAEKINFLDYYENVTKKRDRKSTKLFLDLELKKFSKKKWKKNWKKYPFYLIV